MIGEKPRQKLTYADYLAAPEDKRYELLDGELLETPSPGEAHQRFQAELGFFLGSHIRERRIGRLYLSLTEVVLSDVDVVQPDLLFVSNERMDIIVPSGVHGGPDLVVEILSPATAERDQVYKRALYARHGVKEYWLVGTDAGTIAVLLLGDEGYEVMDTFGEGDTLKSPTLEGCSLKVDEVFGE
ncbi:MAG: Uma2 family endonuclease [Caldilineaceae bacterium]|nr:Uma2 family endonuclease [Caldilineaceae bacterium]MDE0069662.1 Uma2 family endonuclease [Caldilineaceae bacterium]